MFSGIQEILLILLIVLAVVFFAAHNRSPPNTCCRWPGQTQPLSETLRSLAVGHSGLDCLAFSDGGLFRTLASGSPPYLYAGAGPVALFWGILWIAAGFRKHRKKPRDSYET